MDAIDRATPGDDWRDLSDDELVARIAQRGVDGRTADALAAARDDDGYARHIDEILS